MTIEELKQSVHEAALTRPRMVLLPVSDARKLLKVVEAAQQLRLTLTLRDYDLANARLGKALEELNDD